MQSDMQSTQSRSTAGAVIVIVALVVIIGIVGVVFWGSQKNDDASSSTQTTGSSNTTTASNDSNLPTFTASELAKFDGISGNACYVAIDSTVYQIQGVEMWQNGQHIAPGAEGVKCGLDLTEKIKESPHGRSVLSRLSIVGKYSS